MTILVNADTRVICQGMTGWAGTHHTDRMLTYGTKVVAGVTPGKGGRRHLELPVFDTVSEARSETGANASIIFVPAAHAAEAMIEAIEAEIELVVCVTERVPVLDMARVRRCLNDSSTTLVGPNSHGIIAPGVCKLGVMAGVHERPGRIGIASRSATLTSEVSAQTTALGLGQSTAVSVGGDPVHGIGLAGCVRLFLEDPETEGIIIIGEIGGHEEEEVAEMVSAGKPDKPIVAYIAGRHAPAERRMGHAGTLTAFGEPTATAKIERLKRAGVRVAHAANLVGRTMADALAAKS